MIPHDVTSKSLKRIMEETLNPASTNILHSINRSNTEAGIGKVQVERVYLDKSGGYKWRITYVSGTGNVGKDSSHLTVTNMLSGIGAQISIETIIEGNTIGGTFSLSFLNSKTRPLDHDISALDMQRTFLSDIAGVESMSVERTDPSSKCNDGLCKNGPSQAGGYIWTLTITTRVGNVSPQSPTSPLFDSEGPMSNLLVENNLTGCINDICPKIDIHRGHSRSNIHAMRNVKATNPFSFSFGGAGAGYGGDGGEGFGDIPRGKKYGDFSLSKLLGGSGGGMGIVRPFEITLLGNTESIRGGSGGGAIEMIAANDIILGEHASISCNGERGWSGYLAAGGGGSGGSILLSAGGILDVGGKLSTNGGDGGSISPHPFSTKKVDGRGGGGSGGRIAMFSQSIILRDMRKISFRGGRCAPVEYRRFVDRDCHGQNGSFFQEQYLLQDMFVDRKKGAAGSTSSLYIRSSGPFERRVPFFKSHSTQNGPEFSFNNNETPGRVSFFIQLDCQKECKNSFFDGISLELRSESWSEMIHDTSIDFTSVIGLYFGSEMKHGSNYFSLPRDKTHLHHMKSFLSETKLELWYKIDVRLNWDSKKYDIYLDDQIKVQNASFEAETIRSITLNTYGDVYGAWIDEIFVGSDTTMDFKCPISKLSEDIEMSMPEKRGWDSFEKGGESYDHQMQQHFSHLYERAQMNMPNSNLGVPFDGVGHQAFFSDIKSRSDIIKDGKVLLGSLLNVPREIDNDSKDWEMLSGLDDEDAPSKMHELFIWYGEHKNEAKPRSGFVTGDFAQGGIGACSTRDFKVWKNEGIMLNSVNLTDMVNGADGPLHVGNPQVIFNNRTNKFIMWMTLDNVNRDLAMAAVAVSDFANGPFTFIRSFYPDGNQTRDHAIYKEENSDAAYLIRTYYATVDYVLPSAVMQPIWESVKNADGTINFALSHHRANYESGYDDYHDIYLQRWRQEDKPWKILCINRITLMEREVPYGEKYFNYHGDICNDPFEYKKILGQASPLQDESVNGVRSRFLDPGEPSNNQWIPNSVPGVKAQPWGSNYRDGLCGIRKKDNDLGINDPKLSALIVEDRSTCSNIVDNPVHPTLPDKLIGPNKVVQQRRTKFVSISRLTSDYLDTSGIVSNFEGEIDNDADLLSIIQKAKDNPFGWKSDEKLSSTYQPMVHDENFHQAADWDTRFHQYERTYNDRSYYSTSCVYDGENCPVNFKDQLTDQHL